MPFDLFGYFAERICINDAFLKGITKVEFIRFQFRLVLTFVGKLNELEEELIVGYDKLDLALDHTLN